MVDYFLDGPPIINDQLTLGYVYMRLLWRFEVERFKLY